MAMTCNKNATLYVVNKEVIFIKPSRTTPTSILSLSSIDNAPDNNFFIQSLYVYSPNNITKLDPSNVIKEALANALFYYYPLAGKLVRHTDGKLRIICNSQGVPFIEALCNRHLSSLHYLHGSDDDDNDDDVGLAKHFGVDFPSQDEFGNQYPLVLKVTKFSCGGFTLAMGASHAVMDGSGASQFLQAVAELACGKTEPSVKPVWQRETLVGKPTSQPIQNPMDKATTVAVSPFLPSTDFSHVCTKVGSESITRLKMSFTRESSEKGFTTYETLAGYIWRARSRALKLSYDGETMLIMVVGVRPHLMDPLPDGYYGNTIVEACVTLTVRELNEKPLLEVVKLIRERKRVAFRSDYINHAIDTMETKPMRFSYESGAVMTLTDWRHLGLLEKVDFGWNVPVNTMPAPCDGFTSMCNILPPTRFDPSMSGGARVYLCLPSAAMPKFKEEMRTLADLGTRGKIIDNYNQF